MINFLNLEYFVVAAEELNFTKAAKRLFISQQSLSNHIAHIEKEFGVALFNRTTPLTLTYAGQRLLVRARTLLTYKDETYRAGGHQGFYRRPALHRSFPYQGTGDSPPCAPRLPQPFSQH